MELPRVSSGIEGLDHALKGGYIRGRSVLVAGGPGTGKSIMSWHFLYDGIKKGEPGVLVSLDQNQEMIRSDMTRFGWNANDAIESNVLTILAGSIRVVPQESGYEYLIAFEQSFLSEQPLTIPRLADMILRRTSEIKAKRIVIDGLGPLIELAGNSFEMRQLIYAFIRDLTTDDVTVFLTHELRTIPGAVNDEMPFFISDGVIRLEMVYAQGDYIRTMRIVKMRGTDHIMRPIMFKISDHGIMAFPETRLPE